MTKNKQLLEKYDLSSVWSLFTGAAPLGQETAEDLQKIFPSWKIRQGYGMLLEIFLRPDLTKHRSYRNMHCRHLHHSD